MLGGNVWSTATTEEPGMDFATRLRTLMGRRGIGVRALAREVPCDPGLISKLVNGKQRPSRGNAMTGDADATERKLDDAHELMTLAEEHPDSEPPWVYFYSTDYLTLQRARAYVYLHRYAAAAELLTAGLDAIPGEVRGSEWVAWYVADLAVAYRALGDRDEAAKAVAEVARIAAATASPRLAARAAALA